MKMITQKQAILHSLESMNQSEMEQVLAYIKGLLYNPENDRKHQQFKANALREIKKALNTQARLNKVSVS